MDHLTRGRIGWNIVTGHSASGARATGTELIPHDERYDIADEYLDLVYELWESAWEDDAVLRDRERGIFADPAKVHRVRRSGKIQTPDVAALRAERGVRILAVTSRERIASLPGIPAIGELYPGYGVTSWNGLFAPAGTPEPALDRLNAALRVALGDPELRAGLARVDVALVPGGRADLGDLLDREIRQWAALHAQSAITVE